MKIKIKIINLKKIIKQRIHKIIDFVEWYLLKH